MADDGGHLNKSNAHIASFAISNLPTTYSHRFCTIIPSGMYVVMVLAFEFGLPSIIERNTKKSKADADVQYFVL